MYYLLQKMACRIHKECLQIIKERQIIQQRNRWMWIEQEIHKGKLKQLMKDVPARRSGNFYPEHWSCSLPLFGVASIVVVAWLHPVFAMLEHVNSLTKETKECTLLQPLVPSDKTEIMHT